jgi:hypothetical protein
MKYIFKTLLVCIASTLMVGCFEEDFNSPILNDDAEISLMMSSSDVILSQENAEADALTVSWTEPDYGIVVAQPTYEVKVNGITATTTNELSITWTAIELNGFLLANGSVAGETIETSVAVSASLGESVIMANSPITITTYADQLDLTTKWGLVGSATTNGWDGPDMPFYQTSQANVLVAYVTLNDGEVKIRENNSWDGTINYGDSGMDGVLDVNGDNIAVTAGTYKFEWNTESLEYTLESYTWGLVGSATTNGWDGPDMPLAYDPSSDTWKAVVTLASGEIKFRFNNDWGLNYGDTGADGTMESGGDNIVVEEGSYYVTVNLNTLEYSLESTDVWGLVGSATANGWDGPDVQMIRDFSSDNSWYANNVTLTDGEMKFRTNNEWTYNVGDTGADGSLEEGGDNIVIAAGVYDVYLNFDDPSAPTYTLTLKN